MQHRILKMDRMQIRQEGDGRRYLEGYFAVFDQPYQVCDGWEETIAPGAFAGYLASGRDTKVLWNHDSNIVLGSTSNKTAALREDSYGLFGSTEINEGDQDARNAYARVDRGDVDGCSIGFEIVRQEEWWDDQGGYHTKILEVSPLYEVSPCTFPAYGATSISTRAQDNLEAARERKQQAEQLRREQWRADMLARLKGD